MKTEFETGAVGWNGVGRKVGGMFTKNVCEGQRKSSVDVWKEIKNGIMGRLIPSFPFNASSAQH